MKKLLFVAVAVATLVLTSCSKESKINRRLEGTWKATTIDNQAVQSGQSMVVTFSKSEKTTGTGTSSYTYSGMTYNTSFTYSLAEDKLTTVTTVGSSTETSTVTINVYDKDKIEWTNSDGEKTVLIPN